MNHLKNHIKHCALLCLKYISHQHIYSRKYIFPGRRWSYHASGFKNIYTGIYIPLNQLQDTSGSLCFIYNPLKLKLLLFNKKILYRMVPYISGDTLYLWTSATCPKLIQFAIPTLFYPFHPYLPYMPHFI